MATKPETVNLNDLSPQQLKMVHDQLDEEVETLTMSLQALKNAQQRYIESKNCLSEINEANVEKPIMVPLNSSVYVPGKLQDAKMVLVDIGAGYFVEKPIKDAEEFFKRKLDFVKLQMDKIQPPIKQKFQTKQIVAQILKGKVLSKQQAVEKK